MYIEVLRVVNVLVCAGLDTVYDSGFKVEKDGARDISRIVGLVEEDILSITAFRCEVFEVSILVYSVFATELLPEFTTDCLRVSCDPDRACLDCVRRLRLEDWSSRVVGFGCGLTAIAALACLYGYYLSEKLSVDSPRWSPWFSYRGIFVCRKFDLLCAL